MVTAHNELVAPAGAPRPSKWSASIARSSCTRRSGRSRGHYDLFCDMMVDCRECKGRWRADHLQSSRMPAQAEQASRRIREVPAHRAARVQPDVQDDRRRDGHRGGRRLPPPGDGPGHLRQFQERARQHAGRRCRSASRRSARASATRSRRATSRSARASSSRWRSSSSATPNTSRKWYEYWRDRRMAWYTSARPRRRRLAAPRARPATN